MSKRNVLRGSLFSVLGLAAGAILAAAQEPPPPLAGELPKEVAISKGFAMTIAGGMEFNDKLVKGAPFSAQAVTVTDQTLADGNHIHHQNDATLYRDSQGRTRRETTLGGLGPWSTTEAETKVVVMINDPVARVHYLLHPDEHRAIQMPIPSTTKSMNAQGMVPAAKAEGGKAAMEDRVFEAPVPPPLPPPGAPGGEVNVFYQRLGDEEQKGQTESLGTQMIEGVKAEGTRTTSTIAAGSIGNDQPIQIVTERWYSPELQTVVVSKRSDPRVGDTIYRLSNINRAEPATSLFRVPADYTVEKAPGPSVFHFKQSTAETKP